MPYFQVMVFNEVTKALRILIYPLALLLCSCENQECEYPNGDALVLGVPIHTISDSSSITLGDTVKLVSSFSKNMEVVYHSDKMLIENFNFLLTFIIEEISSSTFNTDFEHEVLAQKGFIDTISSSLVSPGTLNAYAITHEETEDRYQFEATIVFHDPGLYYVGFQEHQEGFKYLRHPATLNCEGEPREFFEIMVRNPYGDRFNYDSVFIAKSNIADLAWYYEFEEFQDVGMYAVEVIE